MAASIEGGSDSSNGSDKTSSSGTDVSIAPVGGEGDSLTGSDAPPPSIEANIVEVAIDPEIAAPAAVSELPPPPPPTELSNPNQTTESEMAPLKLETFEQTQNLEQQSQTQFDQFLNARYEDIAEREQIQELVDISQKISTPHFENAKEVAAMDPLLENFSDHRSIHAQQVAEKSIKAADAFAAAARNGNAAYSARVDHKALMVAALGHDVGMDGGMKAGTSLAAQYEAKAQASKTGVVGMDVRVGHPTESAMQYLSPEVREAFSKVEDAPNLSKVAMLEALHSKSSSGVNDLGDPAQLLACAENLKAEADKRGYEFDASFLYDGQNNANPEALRQLATEAAALRVGDSCRDGENFVLTQGDQILVSDGKFDPEAATPQDEILPTTMERYERDGTPVQNGSINGETDNQSVLVHMGECNLQSEPGVSQDGIPEIAHTVKVGDNYPQSTMRAIEDRLGETGTLPKDAPIRHIIQLPSDTSTKVRQDYEAFAAYNTQLSNQKGKSCEVIVK